VGISTASEPRRAAEAAVGSALAAGLRPDAALLFVGPGFGAALPELLATAEAALGTGQFVGASAHGVLACGREVEGAASVAVVALEGCEAHSFLLSDLAGHEASVGSEIAAQIGGAARPEDLVMLFPEPGSLELEILVRSVCEGLGTSTVVGVGAADPVGAAPSIWRGSRWQREGLAGLVLRGARPPRIGVTQACRPVTELLQVTRTQGHWVLGIEGRPALDVFREIAREPLAADLRRAAAFLLVAIPRDPADPLRPGSYVVRHVVGFSEAQRAFALPERVKPGDAIALAVREPESAREDLQQMLAGLGTAVPAVGVYFDCCARGGSFFGIEDLEAAYLDRAFAPAPVAGMFGACEIGPIGRSVELLTYTGVLALLDP